MGEMSLSEALDVLKYHTEVQLECHACPIVHRTPSVMINVFIITAITV